MPGAVASTREVRGGDDYLYDYSGGDDTYRYRSGDGNDWVSDQGGTDTLELLDLNPADVRIGEGHCGHNRLIDQRTGQAITLGLGLGDTSWSQLNYSVEQVRFADGTVWGTEQLRNAMNANETVTGGAEVDTLEGFGGNDMLAAAPAAIRCAAVRATIPTCSAGARRAIGSKKTIRVQAPSTHLKRSPASTSISFGSDLEVSIIGTNDRMLISNWYLGGAYRIEQFKTSDGQTLLDSQVQDLVQAMAGFAPPAAGQTTLPASYQNSLATVIAASWQ